MTSQAFSQIPSQFIYQFRTINTDPSCATSSNESEFQICYQESYGLIGIEVTISDCDIDVTDEGDFEEFQNHTPGVDLMMWGGDVNLDAFGCFTFKGILPPNSNGCPIRVVIRDQSNGNVVMSDQIHYVSPYQSIGSPNNSTNISSAGLASGQIHGIKVFGNLVIDQDFTFRSGSELIMSSSDAKITINGSQTLNLFSTSIHGCDGLEWEGIKINPGGLADFNLSVIEDALDAVFVDNGSYEGFLNTIKPNANGLIAINNSIIQSGGETYIGQNGGTGISVENSDLLIGGAAAGFSRFDEKIQNFTTGIDVKSSIMNNVPLFYTKISDNNLGINISDFSLVSYASASRDEQSIFDNNTGILSLNSALTIQNTWVDNNDHFGVQWTSDIGNNKLSVVHNRIENNGEIGLIVFNEGLSDKEIKDNTFNANKVHSLVGGGFYNSLGVRITNNEFNSATGMIGLQLINTGLTQVFNNDFTGSNGALVYSSNADNNNYKCNDFDNGSIYGLYIRDAYSAHIDCNRSNASSGVGLQLEGNCDVSTIRGNTWTGVTYDMQYGSSSGNAFAISGPQPSTKFLQVHGNKFTKGEVKNNDALSVPSNTYFEQGVNQSSIYNPNSDPSDWFKDSWNNSFRYSCYNQCPNNSGPPIMPPINDREEDLINGLLTYNYQGGAIDYNALEKIYRRIIALNDPANNGLKTTIENNTTVDEFYLVETALTDKKALSPSDITAIDQAILIYQTNAMLIDSLVRDTSEEYHLDDITIVPLITEMRLKRNFVNGINTANHQDLLTYLTTASVSLATISVTSSYEVNRKKILEADIALLTTKYDELTGPMKQDIANIAALCPYIDGLAVYQARGILLENTVIDPQLWLSDCPGGQSMLADNGEELNNENIEVFPNPVSDLLHINMNGLDLGELQIELINNLGQVVERRTSVSSGLVEIDTKELSTGIYWLRILSNEQQIYHQKLIKQ